MTTLVNESFALLIGVDDYSAYDPEQNLRGSVNDVAAWQRICHAIGMKPENVHILGTKTFEDGAVKNEHWSNRFGEVSPVREATRENLLAEVKWLADKLASGGVPGLLTYSGHGDITDQGELALCPSDVKKDGASIANLVTLRELADLLAVGKARDLLTVVFDCCHAGKATRPLSKALSLRGAAGSEKGERPRVGARELYACGADQVAFQSEFTSQFHGAFTWALTASLLQWKVIPRGSSVDLSLTYGNACAVNQKLLGVLEYGNQSASFFPPEIADMTFFHAGTKAEPGLKSAHPDGARDQIQLDPNVSYSIYLGTDANASLLAQVVVTGTTSVYIQGHTDAPLTTSKQEYWFTDNAKVQSLFTDGATNLFISQTSLAGNTSENPLPLSTSVAWPHTFTKPAAVASWDTLAAPATSSSSKVYTFSGTVTGPSGVTGYVLLNVTSATRNNVTTYKLEHVYWYLPDASIPTTGNKTFNPTSPTGTCYASATLPGYGIKGAISR